jgi:hypothetical protein
MSEHMVLSSGADNNKVTLLLLLRSVVGSGVCVVTVVVGGLAFSFGTKREHEWFEIPHLLSARLF